ncbi:hypothetical protein IWW36_001039 [Coemansia brasiliensis]|uniref:Uncharacterized protein n=1 Tax=Coemansia brasiliensis TaxID=2650707 RepID=A0A9W8I9Z5_9FUNG|nr:hypothetical protein IWW36_001039 [Coemansia brasiliensis]
MRVGSNNISISRTGASSSSQPAAPHSSEHLHLSFGRPDQPNRLAGRRRVFARLAPYNADLQAGQASSTPAAAVAESTSSNAIDDSSGSEDNGSDEDMNADQYFDQQMLLLPPTPPRRRAADSDLEADFDAGVAGRRAVGSQAEQEAQVRRALAQFGQLRRQRFLRDQRQWHNASFVRASNAPAPHPSLVHPWGQSQPSADSAEASPDAIPQLFPSNDVDSYWYNQPEPELVASSDGFMRSSTTHPATSSMQPGALRRSGNLPPPVRNSAAEASRSAMLGVLRTHRAFSASNPEEMSDHEGPRHSPGIRESSWLSSIAADEAEQGRTEKPEAAENDDNEGPMSIDSRASGCRSQRVRQSSVRAEERVLKWLKKNSVPVQDLSCSLLQPGMRFRGIQRVTPQIRDSARSSTFARLRGASLEQWDVSVEIQTVDMKRGCVSGLMMAINVPRLPKTVVTCWKGEIVDFVNFTPLTAKWRAKCSDDSRHWSLFPAVRNCSETFLHKLPESMHGKVMPRILEEYLFMRWKEVSFVNAEPSETGLTIEGFYYVCMNRKTGAIDGVYFDPSTQPYQRLTLNVDANSNGMSFASAECC